MTTYAILGSGAIGAAVAGQFARKGIEVLIANSRGPETLADLAHDLGPGVVPATLRDALAADIVILAVPYDAVRDAVHEAPAWNGRIVVDATNAIDFPAFTPRDLGGRPSTHIVAEAVPGARVVKAFNTLPAAVLAKDPQENGRRVLFLSGDDEGATAEVAGLIERLGFAPIPLGRIAEGGRLQQFGGALMVHSLIRQG
ncbi:NADPH-dependent F420 reductase [Azospirillum thermophilum]|uniref:NADP oxidoreductase n=1 Tax=Azospirillum thermophilum TaxID=2202148 RepID=A0A2S2CKJ2_9PROT|nr:NADPH-dependent F420 reductase [Azospirillum thermophilum]AWK84949.1 NADP oxidoreductase [Azospirillum thermophilum]